MTFVIAPSAGPAEAELEKEWCADFFGCGVERRPAPPAGQETLYVAPGFYYEILRVVAVSTPVAYAATNTESS